MKRRKFIAGLGGAVTWPVMRTAFPTSDHFYQFPG
jgi:hypothetical protein